MIKCREVNRAHLNETRVDLTAVMSRKLLRRCFPAESLANIARLYRLGYLGSVRKSAIMLLHHSRRAFLLLRPYRPLMYDITTAVVVSWIF